LITVLQTSVENEEFVPDAGSYAKSRTRATVALSGWKFEKKGDDTELTYVVKVFLNGEWKIGKVEKEQYKGKVKASLELELQDEVSLSEW